ncbi:hypothetical protein EUX98_g1386 [Antrodiella citrinella]|uniref:GPI-anchored wall transfer protein 1 n=1 Tax=Antrodiella citrinella TaxID=2447956 RepID=A0A4S4N1K7_9APHY|nr:hypothetical protein EUX98_g1386 [Antrodiella citrinella]
MLLLTSICILAVDFPVFPRALAKCETFGVSVMDLGVGSFVFSQGLVSAIPIIKNPATLTAPMPPKLSDALRKSLPVLILGLLRTISVKGAEYPEHESEYGTHWNFFITLGLLPVLQVLLHPIILYLPISMLGLIIAFSHQIALSSGGLASYIFHEPRVNLISQNKEGLISLTENDKTAIELCSWAVVWWVLLAVERSINMSGGISRRLVNLPYVTYVAAFNTSFLLGYLILDLVFFPSPMSKSVYSPNSGLKVQTPTRSARSILAGNGLGSGSPKLLDAINKNGLVFFLVANVTTGLVNLAIPTMYASDSKAMVVLGVYTFWMCAGAWLCRGRRLWRF